MKIVLFSLEKKRLGIGCNKVLSVKKVVKK